MKLGLISCCFIILLSGCGKLNNKRPLAVADNKGVIAGLEKSTEHKLKIDELTIANRVCVALVAKRENLESLDSQIAYNFDFESKTCASTKIQTLNFNADISIVSGELVFNTKVTPMFFTNVITDHLIAIKHICEEVLNSTTKLEEKIDISNAVVDLDKLYLVKFGVADKGFDTIQIDTKKIDSAGVYNPLNTTLVTIYTKSEQLNASVKTLGIEKERIEYTPCQGTKIFSSRKEIFQKAVKSL